MKTFEDFLHEENKDSEKISLTFTTKDVQNILKVYNKFKAYQKQVKLRDDIITFLHTVEIVDTSSGKLKTDGNIEYAVFEAPKQLHEMNTLTIKYKPL